MNTANPWNLSLHTQQALEAYVAHGFATPAAESLGLTRQAFGARVRRARIAMKEQSNLRTILAWDRFAYGREPRA